MSYNAYACNTMPLYYGKEVDEIAKVLETLDCLPGYLFIHQEAVA
jgi:hypothetical protein